MVCSPYASRGNLTVLAKKHPGRRRPIVDMSSSYHAPLSKTWTLVWLNNSARSRCVTRVVAQQPAQTITTPHLAAMALEVCLRCDELVGKALMIALRMIVSQVLLDRIIQGVFTQYDHLLEGLLLDGAHEPFAVRVEVRTPWRQEVPRRCP